MLLDISDAGGLLVILVVKAIFGAICAGIASGRGRSAAGWFFIGMALDCLALILVLVLPDLRQQEQREKHMRLENRRLREQLSKERQVSDHRHHHVERRLSVHDEALGVDTSKPPELPGSAPAPAQLGRDGQWFYARDNERLGPVSAATIRHLLQTRAISASTLVWCQGMRDWVELQQVDAFAEDVL